MEQAASEVEASIREHFAQERAVAAVEPLHFLSNNSSDEEVGSILALTREKAVEFSSEKAACVERVNAISQLVSKQVKGIVDARFK